MLHWSRPELLVLLIAVPWFWWSAAHARRPPTRRTTIARSLVAVLLVLAAAGTSIAVRSGRLSIVYAVDRSESISARSQSQALASINAWSDTMRPGDTAGIVVFGSAPVVERSPVEHLRVSAITSAVSSSGTNLSAALSAASAALPPQGRRRIVLLSDGRQTAGDVRRETAVLASQGVAVDVALPADESSRAQVVATRVEAPADVRANEPFLVSVEFAGRPGGKGQLSVTRDGQPFARQDVVVPAGGTGSIAFEDEHRQGGIHGYQATVRDELDDGFLDDAPGSDGAGAMVSVEAPPAILLRRRVVRRSLHRPSARRIPRHHRTGARGALLGRGARRLRRGRARRRACGRPEGGAALSDPGLRRAGRRRAAPARQPAQP